MIEFANTQLLEMRYLDQQLDDALERAYGLVRGREVGNLREVRKGCKVPDAAISRKLSTLDSIFAKTVDRTASRRMEVLEWIIIVLIAVSIVISIK